MIVQIQMLCLLPIAVMASLDILDEIFTYIQISNYDNFVFNGRFFFFFWRMGNWILAQKKKEGYWIYMHFIPKQKRKEKIV